MKKTLKPEYKNYENILPDKLLRYCQKENYVIERGNNNTVLAQFVLGDSLHRALVIADKCKKEYLAGLLCITPENELVSTNKCVLSVVKGAVVRIGGSDAPLIIADAGLLVRIVQTLGKKLKTIHLTDAGFVVELTNTGGRVCFISARLFGGRYPNFSQVVEKAERENQLVLLNTIFNFPAEYKNAEVHNIAGTDYICLTNKVGWVEFCGRKGATIALSKRYVDIVLQVTPEPTTMALDPILDELSPVLFKDKLSTVLLMPVKIR